MGAEKTQFFRQGWTVTRLEDIPATDWIKDLPVVEHHITDPGPPRVIHTHAGDYDACRNALGEGLNFLTGDVWSLVEHITGLDLLMPSQYCRSSVTAKGYGPGHVHGWHYESNSVTGILCLQPAQEGGDLLVKPINQPNGDTTAISYDAHDLVILRGHDVLHRGDAVRQGFKGIMVFNFYLEGEVTRPENLNAQHYETEQNRTGTHTRGQAANA